MEKYVRKPHWIKSIVPSNNDFKEIRKALKFSGIHTVCEEAKCPNLGECWQKRTATIMILGDICTRGCRFCNVKTAKNGKELGKVEVEKSVDMVKLMGLRYIVITSVDRDDLVDYGSTHFAAIISGIKNEHPDVMVEVLIPDFNNDGSCLNRIGDANPYVIAHNLETVERITPIVRDRKSSYRKSLNVLKYFKKCYPGIPTKSSLMVGLGEDWTEIERSMDDLIKVGVKIITFGQYLQPTRKHLRVEKYYTPEEFSKLSKIAYAKGFEFVASGPMVRSSYRADEYAKQI